MASVHDIAAYILKRQGAMAAMKLQKLVYYAQAWALVRLQRALFDEPIRAWAHGPVVYELFEIHRGHWAVASPWPKGDPAALSGPSAELIDAVLDRYGQMSATELSDRTHQELPWRTARGNLPEKARSTTEISLESMREFYSQQVL